MRCFSCVSVKTSEINHSYCILIKFHEWYRHLTEAISPRPNVSHLGQCSLGYLMVIITFLRFNSGEMSNINWNSAQNFENKEKVARKFCHFEHSMPRGPVENYFNLDQKLFALSKISTDLNKWKSIFLYFFRFVMNTLESNTHLFL